MLKGTKKIIKAIDRVAAALEKHNDLLQEQVNRQTKLTEIYDGCVDTVSEFADEIDTLALAVAQLQRNYLAVDENDY
jgi:hypothetical protein